LREIGVVLDGAVAGMERERKMMLSMAWHIEAFARSKKLPPLEKILGNQQKATGRRMSPEQIEAITRSWLSSRTKR
jgi:hypothetical protein